MSLLNSDKKYPMTMPDGTVIKQTVYLKEVLKHHRINVGEFSYYHNFEELKNYASFLAPYLFPFSEDSLIIGKFVQIAHGVRFITNSANHKLDGFSTYPFNNFMMTSDTTNEDIMNMLKTPKNKGNSIVENDVWIGFEAIIMPGVKIGNGAIIGAKSVVTKDVKLYTVVGGNPARFIKQRFDDNIIEILLKIKWWDWSIEKIEDNIDIIIGKDIKALKALE